MDGQNNGSRIWERVHKQSYIFFTKNPTQAPNRSTFMSNEILADDNVAKMSYINVRIRFINAFQINAQYNVDYCLGAIDAN